MSEWTGTGQTLPGVVFSSPGFRKNTAGQEDRLLSYGLTYEKSSVAREVKIIPAAKQLLQKSEAPDISAKRSLQAYLQKALASAVALEEAATRQDPVESSIIGTQLIDYLAELWALRNLKQREWQMVLNFLQSALSKTCLERLSLKQCQGVRKTVDDFLAGGSITRERAKNAVKTMKEADLDVWKGISMPEEDPGN